MRRRLRPAVLAVAAAAVLLALPAGAHAEAVGSAELRSLAERAATDPAALERLRGVDRVDGRTVDVGAALDGVAGAELQARLATLGRAAGAPPPPDPAGARAEARAILDGRRFSPPEVPGPFRGVLRRLSDWLAPVLDVIPALDDLVPGGRPVVWVLLLVLVGAAAAALAGRSLRRRVASAGRVAGGSRGPVADDPDALERLAREAAARGEHELALRLGFRAGLARLDRRGVIELRPSLSTGEVARAVHSDEFDRAAARFDEVVYGGRRAAADDVDAARAAWAAALAERTAA